jgi:hypothetical protein
LLGMDYCAAVPRAGTPIADILRGANASTRLR